MDILTKILLGLLTLDTIRAVIAMLGWVKPESKLSWLIYGRYDRNLIVSALKEMGYHQEERTKIIKNMKKLAKEFSRKVGVNEQDAALRLIILLAKYTEKFPEQIQFGGDSISKSHFFIDTMEISHDETDLKIMHAVMIHLLNKKHASRKKPSVIISPKGGNPIFVETIANALRSKFIIAKAKEDQSRISGFGCNPKDLFKVNYEGSWTVLESKNKLDCILMDCNTTTGKQLIDIVEEVNKAGQHKKNPLKINNPREAFVLFCADTQNENIDDKFNSLGIKLHRIFDLNEETKEMLYALRERCESEHRLPNYFVDKDKDEAIKIIEKLKAENNYFY